MGFTVIEYLNKTWNVCTGCAPVGEGCRNCWARETHDTRHVAYRTFKPGPDKRGWPKRNMPEQYATPFEKVVCHEGRLLEPLSWCRPQRVGVAYTGDLFHDDVPATFIDRVMAMAALCPQHTFMLLTKRPERMLDYARSRMAIDDGGRVGHMPQWYRVITDWLDEGAGGRGQIGRAWNRCHEAASKLDGSPPANVMLGASVWDQSSFDSTIEHMQELHDGMGWRTWLSCEPLLGPIVPHKPIGGQPGVDLVIIGGESCRPRSRARPCNVAWVRDLVDHCVPVGVAVHVKQLGSCAYDMSRASTVAGSRDSFTRDELTIPEHAETAARVLGEVLDAVGLDLRHPAGGDPAEWPEDLRPYHAWPNIEQARGVA